MKKIIFLLAILFIPTLFTRVIAAEAEDKGPNAFYYQFQPGFVTNYQKSRSGHLGFVRADMQVQVATQTDVDLVHQHYGLLRDAILQKLFELTKDKISSIEYREVLREEIKVTLQNLLKEETGKPLITELLFTQFLYQ